MGYPCQRKVGVLRITKSVETESAVTLNVEGQIASDWVSILQEETLGVLKEGRRVVLDLSEVTYIDFKGVRMVKSLAADKVEIINCPRLIRDLLNKDRRRLRIRGPSR